MLVPLVEKSLEHTKINGKKITNMQGVVLKPNDRICIGPSAIFLFKNRDKEADASMPDLESDPISFDFASEEVESQDQDADQKAQKEAIKKAQEEAAASAIKQIKEKFEKEKMAELEEIKKKQAEADSAAGADKDRI